MRRFLSRLLLGAGLTFGFSGCIDVAQPEYIEGTVLSESGSVVNLEPVPAARGFASQSNETVRIGDPTYGLDIRADRASNEIYTADIREGHLGDNMRTISSLARRIESEEDNPDNPTRVRFYTGRSIFSDGRYSTADNHRFGEDRIGFIYSDEITVLD